MCGRYYVDDSMIGRIEKALSGIDNRLSGKTFSREDKTLLYLAGIADVFDRERRFVILTTQANASMEKVHDRMPLILEPAQVRDWLLNDKATDSILKQTPVMLDKYTEYEQLTFFDL